MKNRIINNKIIKTLLVLTIIATIIALYINKEYIFLNKVNTNDTIGIIDGRLSNYHNIISSSNVNYELYGDRKYHGDYLLEFVKNYSDANVSYYDASNSEGKIKTSEILNGLNWMKENNIKNINISMSSNKFSEELQDWINKNKEFQIYSSYNNIENSFDFPAMYENVISSGTSKEIMHKESDVFYKSNKLIIKFNISKAYKGNSYLSLVTLLNEMDSK